MEIVFFIFNIYIYRMWLEIEKQWKSYTLDIYTDFKCTSDFIYLKNVIKWTNVVYHCYFCNDFNLIKKYDYDYWKITECN